MADASNGGEKIKESERNNDDEILLYVSKESVNHPVGFVIDAGGSTSKVVYRSKKDYNAGKAIKPMPNSELGVLRLRYFNMDQVGNIIDFLKENCDVIDGGDDDDDIEWWITGITTQHFKKKVESAFGIKTKLLSEMMGIDSFFRNYDKIHSGCYGVDLEALTWAKETGRLFFDSFLEWQKMDPTFSEETKVVTGNVVMELFEGEVKDWCQKVLPPPGEFKFPALLIHMGSAMPIALVTEERKVLVVDFMSGMGKMICGLSEELTDESNFDKFIEMAERGNIDNVDLIMDDVRNADHNEDDWYKPMAGYHTAFELGKLSSNNVIGKGNYNKDDLAIGILCAMIKLITKITILNAKLHKAKSILFSGSLPKYKLVRHHLSRNLWLEAIITNLKGMDMVTIDALKHPGFICALGVWMENVELNKKRQNVTENNDH